MCVCLCEWMGVCETEGVVMLLYLLSLIKIKKKKIYDYKSIKQNEKMTFLKGLQNKNDWRFFLILSLFSYFFCSIFDA